MEKLTILSISKNEIPSILLDRMEEPMFIDTDIEFNEKMFDGAIFENISKDDLTQEELRELLYLREFSKDCVYIHLTD
jgi:hypothetical protein